MKRTIAALLCLILLLAVGMTGCGKKEAPAGNTILLTDGSTYGSGANQFTFVTEDLNGKQTTVTVASDLKTVGEALTALNIVDGETGEWGLYVKTVNGITLDYDRDGKYWAFYIDGEYAMTGVDTTEIIPGAVYALVPEQ